MRTILRTIQLYAYVELSDNAKERVKEWVNQGGHNWGAESLASLSAFAAQFGAKVTDYEYGPWNNANISTDATPANFRGFTLRKARTLPEFPTGYCLDCTLLEVFIKQFEHTGNAHTAFNEAMDAGITEACADWEYQYSEEAMQEICEANEYEFTEEGTLV